MPKNHTHVDTLNVKCKKLERGECQGDEPCELVQKLLGLGGPTVECEPASTPVYVWDDR